MNKHKIVRGSLALLIILVFGIVVFGRDLGRAAEADQTQYLPLIPAPDCIPGSIIESDNLAKDLAVEAGINDIRANNGLSILTNAHKLTQAALRHSHDLADNNYIIGHVGTDGSTPGQRLNEACYRWLTFGEIVAGGFDGKPEKVIDAWMNSPGHRDAILSGFITEFGAGYAYKSRTTYKHYFTVNFGLPDMTLKSGSQEYYSCSYHLKDESGESWLNMYSIWPCDQLLDLPAEIGDHR